MYSVVITSSAEKDLEEIFRYISENLEARPSAVHVLSKLEEKINGLKTMPHFREFEFSPEKYRIIHYSRYNILFRLDEDNKTVYIARVLLASRSK